LVLVVFRIIIPHVIELILFGFITNYNKMTKIKTQTMIYKTITQKTKNIEQHVKLGVNLRAPEGWKFLYH